MKVFSPKMALGVFALSGLMSAGLVSCKQEEKEPSPLQKARTHLNDMRFQYNRDSLDYINSDSVKASEKFTKLTGLKQAYLGVHCNDNLSDTALNSLYEKVKASEKYKGMSYEEFRAEVKRHMDELKESSMTSAEIEAIIHGDKNIAKMNEAIYDAKKQIDISTGKVFQKTKEKLAQAEKDVQIQELIEKLANNIPLIYSERIFLENEYVSIFKSLVEKPNVNNERIIKNIDLIRRKTLEADGKDEIMKEFEKVISE